MEFAFNIGGKLGGSFKSTFNAATNSLRDLRGEARETQRAINRINNDFRAGRIHQSQYASETARLTREMNRLQSAERKRAMFDSAKNKVKQTTSRVKTTAGIAALGATAAGTKLAFDSLNTAAEFESELTKGAVKMGASREEMEKLSDTALKLSSDSKLSSIQVGQAMDEMAAKGLNANQTMAAMPGMIAGAEASGEDLALVADTTMSALNAFGMGSGEASRVADIMAMAANATAAGVSDMGYAFKYAAPVAKTLGISIEELAGATGLMVNKGLAGEQAGTALRMALKRLASPPKLAAKSLKELNMTAVTSKGKFKSLAEITEDWTKSTAKLTDVQKVQHANNIFGAEAASAMLAYFETGPKKVREMTKALEESEGSAKKNADAMKDNYQGSKTTLISTFEAAKIAFAKPILPVGRQIMDSLSSGIKSNFSVIESAGKSVAKGLEDIFEPFIKKKPKITPEIKQDPDAMEQYFRELSEYNNFKSMDFGDKVIYGLDEISTKAEDWINGSGGDTMTRIFEKLGEMGAKAWANAFSRTASSAFSNAMDGNVGGALGMGAMAWALGGGAIAKGLFGAGKYGYGKVKNRTGRRGGTTTPSSNTPSGDTRTTSSRTTSTVNTGTRANTSRSATNTDNDRSGTNTVGTRRSRTSESVTTTRGTTTRSDKKLTQMLKPLGKFGKYAGKIGGPLALLGGAAAIATSDDKTKTTASTAGGLAGGLAGAGVGATLGSAVPVIGTAIGGLAGGVLGSMGGSAALEKVVDLFRGSPKEQPSTVTQPQQTQVQQVSNPQAQTDMQFNTQMSAVNSSLTQLQTAATTAATNMQLLTSYVGQASGWVVGGFYPLQGSGTVIATNTSILTSYLGQASGWVVSGFYPLESASAGVVSNLNILTSYVGQASGWVATLSGIQTASNNVISALNNLTAKINAVQVPSAKGGRTAFE